MSSSQWSSPPLEVTSLYSLPSLLVSAKLVPTLIYILSRFFKLANNIQPLGTNQEKSFTILV